MSTIIVDGVARPATDEEQAELDRIAASQKQTNVHQLALANGEAARQRDAEAQAVATLQAAADLEKRIAALEASP